MLKKFHLTFFVLSALYSSSQELRLPWSPDYKLAWEDFQGTVMDTLGATALTVAVIDVSYRYIEDSSTVSVFNHFLRNESFVDHTEFETSTDSLTFLLEHEQIHFDLTEVYTRLIRKRLKSLIEINNNEGLVNHTINLLQAELEEMHNEYDLYTGHGANRFKQNEWRLKVDGMLMELADYYEPNEPAN